MISPIIILGMHRSGTSLVAGCLEAAGLYLGPVNNYAPFNKKGNKENESIRDLHDSILMRHGLDWKSPPGSPVTWTEQEKQKLFDLLRPYRSAQRPWGIKDPRTIWLLNGWLEIFPDADIVAVFRHPTLVARSLSARAGSISLPLESAYSLWRATNQRIIDLRQNIEFRLLHYAGQETIKSSFFEPLSVFAKSHNLNGDPMQFYDPGLTNQFLLGDHLSPDLLQIYDQLVELNENPKLIPSSSSLQN